MFRAMSNDVAGQPAAERALRILRPQPRVAKALEMSGFSRLIPNYSDEQEAIESFGSGA